MFIRLSDVDAWQSKVLCPDHVCFWARNGLVNEAELLGPIIVNETSSTSLTAMKFCTCTRVSQHSLIDFVTNAFLIYITIVATAHASPGDLMWFTRPCEKVGSGHKSR